MTNNKFKNADFLNDEEKMRDFKILSKEEFLESYSYLTEEEYDNTYNKYYATKNEYHWISVKDALPEEDKSVLLTYLAYPDYQTPTVDNSFGYLHKGEWYWVEEDEDSCRQKIKVPVTAWMAITPYEEKNERKNKTNIKEEKEAMRILLKEDVKAKLDENFWRVYENEKDIDFSTLIADKNFSVVIDKGNSLTDLAHNIYEYWNSFDVSYETLQKIGKDGHGINGAPYDLKEVYEEVEWTKERIENLYGVINEEAEIEAERKTKIQKTKYTLKDKIFETVNVLERSKQRLTELKTEIGDPIGTSDTVTEDDNLIYELELAIERFNKYALMTDNCADYIEALNCLSVSELKQIVENYVFLNNRYSKDAYVQDKETSPEQFETDLKPLTQFLNKLKTEKFCPKCGESLFKSDFPQYDYVCTLCDEHFHENAVK